MIFELIDKIKELFIYVQSYIQRGTVEIPYPVTNGQYPVTQSLTHFGQTIISETILPYGIAASAPEGSPILHFLIGGSDCNRVNIISHPQSLPNLLVSEVATGNFVSGTYFKHTVAGTIEVWSKNALICPDLVAFIKTHTHGGVEPGAGNTLPPNPIT